MDSKMPMMMSWRRMDVVAVMMVVPIDIDVPKAPLLSQRHFVFRRCQLQDAGLELISLNRGLQGSRLTIFPSKNRRHFVFFIRSTRASSVTLHHHAAAPPHLSLARHPVTLSALMDHRPSHPPLTTTHVPVILLHPTTNDEQFENHHLGVVGYHEGFGRGKRMKI